MDGVISEYHKDFYGWLIHNAKLMRLGKLAEIDIENIAEELEAMGRSEKRELVNRLAVLLAHLLKWAYQPQRRGNSWKYTIKEQREALLEVLEDSPSLQYELEEKFLRAYKRAVLIAVKETKLKEKTFPAQCPFSLEEVLDDEFYPSE